MIESLALLSHLRLGDSGVIKSAAGFKNTSSRIIAVGIGSHLGLGTSGACVAFADGFLLAGYVQEVVSVLTLFHVLNILLRVRELLPLH